MSIDAESAKDSLCDIDAVVSRFRQSSLYRGTSVLVMLWGALVACGYVSSTYIPERAGLIWILADSVGLMATFAIGLRYRHRGAEFDWRIVVAVLLFFAFGMVCSRIGHFGWRESDAFWPILFMFGYALAGLWLGRVFIWLGLGVAALSFAGYLWVEHWFELYLACVDGGGMILAGLWMRRA